MPQALIDQLARPGRMFIPVGSSSQAIYLVDKDADGNVSQQKLFGVRYVPLTDLDDSLRATS
jgi:protein-L-isoaspartate(D-aspartate) O-methyltransferase